MAGRTINIIVFTVGVIAGVLLALALWQQLTPDGRTLALWYALGLSALFGVMALWWRD